MIDIRCSLPSIPCTAHSFRFIDHPYMETLLQAIEVALWQTFAPRQDLSQKGVYQPVSSVSTQSSLALHRQVHTVPTGHCERPRTIFLETLCRTTELWRR